VLLLHQGHFNASLAQFDAVIHGKATTDDNAGDSAGAAYGSTELLAAARLNRALALLTVGELEKAAELTLDPELALSAKGPLGFQTDGSSRFVLLAQNLLFPFLHGLMSPADVSGCTNKWMVPIVDHAMCSLYTTWYMVYVACQHWCKR
jgi:hypothetical protein